MVEQVQKQVAVTQGEITVVVRVGTETIQEEVYE